MIDAQTPSLVRREGWESRLATVVEAARHQPYVLGKHDCFRFACAAVEALTFVDLWAPWAGRYHTRHGALRLLVEYGGGFTGAFTRLFGVEPRPLTLVHRGDIAQYTDPQGESHLGVVCGGDIWVLGADGLLPIRRGLGTHAWCISWG